MRYKKHTSVRMPRSTSHDAPRTTNDDTIVELSAKTSALVEGLRVPFKAYVTEFKTFVVSRDELAPKFMKAFETWKKETKRTFVEFVREFDATIGNRADYRAHPTYQAADYLRRKVAELERKKKQTPTERAATIASRPSTPLDGMARLVAAVLPLISADQIDRLWSVIGGELHWSERQVESLQSRVKSDETTPLVTLRPLRGQGGVIPQLRIAPPKHEEVEELKTGTNG